MLPPPTEVRQTEQQWFVLGQLRLMPRVLFALICAVSTGYVPMVLSKSIEALICKMIGHGSQIKRRDQLTLSTGSHQENTGTHANLPSPSYWAGFSWLEWSYLQLVKEQLLTQRRFGYDALGEASKGISLQTFLTQASATLTSDEAIIWKRRTLKIERQKEEKEGKAGEREGGTSFHRRTSSLHYLPCPIFLLVKRSSQVLFQNSD